MAGRRLICSAQTPGLFFLCALAEIGVIKVKWNALKSHLCAARRQAVPAALILSPRGRFSRIRVRPACAGAALEASGAPDSPLCDVSLTRGRCSATTSCPRRLSRDAKNGFPCQRIPASPGGDKHPDEPPAGNQTGSSASWRTRPPLIGEECGDKEGRLHRNDRHRENASEEDEHGEERR